jgi:heavy metal sensor kinase
MVTLTRSITAEDLSLRLEPIESHDEIGELADTLNEMISRLDRSFKQIKQFSGDVSHELKTPLTELKCNAEVALRQERTTEEYQETLKNVIEDAEQLQHIVEDLLLLARMDARSLPFSFTTVTLNEVFLEVFEHAHPFARKKNLALSFGEINPVTIIGDVGLLKRLLTNLIANAIQYTPSGGKLTFALRKKSNQAVLSIADTGIGIPKNALPYIFDRFYRVEQSRSHETGGSGLGLAIAQKIVEVHAGKISVQSTVGQGTTFRVCLPCSYANGYYEHQRDV